MINDFTFASHTLFFILIMLISKSPWCQQSDQTKIKTNQKQFSIETRGNQATTSVLKREEYVLFIDLVAQRAVFSICLCPELPLSPTFTVQVRWLVSCDVFNWNLSVA